MRLRSSTSALCSLLVVGLVADVANAACTRLAFSVNDYGKDGPTRDAKDLLDKYIAKWTAERGIKKYTTGKKEVTCELFLDVILFDEHTCKAAASVCWDGAAPAGVTADSGTGTKPKKAPAAKAAKSAAAPVATGSIPAAAPAPVPGIAAPSPAPAADIPAIDAPKPQ